MPNRRTRRSLLVLVLTLGTVWLAPTTARAAVACGAWTVVPSPNRGTHGSTLVAVSAVTPDDVWAVGTSYTGSVYRTLAEHWDGASWTVVPTRNVGTNTNALTSVVAVSATDVWAVGFYADGTTFRTLAEHWDGTSWKVVTTPNDGSGENVLESVSAVTGDDVWAVGFQEALASGPRRTLAEHWDGDSWSVVPTPDVGADENFLWSVQGRTASDAWAVGSYSVPWFQTLTERWNGTTWEVVPSPNLGDGNNVLYASVVFAGARAMAVGTWLDGNQTATLAQRWNGTAWEVVSSPSPASETNWLAAASATDGGNIWAVGFRIDAPFTPSRTLAERWNGHAWSVVRTPNVGSDANALAGVAAVPGSSDVWAVGHSTAGAVDQTLVEFRC